jgi:hypothetical protein
VEHPCYLLVALVLFGLIVALSILYSGLPAYRQLRAARAKKWWANDSPEDKLKSPQDSYSAHLWLERSIYGTPHEKTECGEHSPGRKGTLQDQLDRERRAVIACQRGRRLPAARLTPRLPCG